MPQEMVFLKLQIVGSSKQMCMKAFILTILLAGNSWRFKRFDRLCITVNGDELRSIGK